MSLKNSPLWILRFYDFLGSWVKKVMYIDPPKKWLLLVFEDLLDIYVTDDPGKSDREHSFHNVMNLTSPVCSIPNPILYHFELLPTDAQPVFLEIFKLSQSKRLNPVLHCETFQRFDPTSSDVRSRRDLRGLTKGYCGIPKICASNLYDQSQEKLAIW